MGDQEPRRHLLILDEINEQGRPLLVVPALESSCELCVFINRFSCSRTVTPTCTEYPNLTHKRNVIFIPPERFEEYLVRCVTNKLTQ